MFGRKKGKEGADDEVERSESRATRRARNDAAAARREHAAEQDDVEAAPTQSPDDGPYDVTDAPDDGMARLDLGALRVPTPDGIELRLEATPTGEVAAILLVDGDSAAQVGVFAAPRTQAIWSEVRGEIIEQLATEGGQGQVQDGPFGTEIFATVAGPEGPAVVRFLGVDGPRWFLRAVISGPAASSPEAAAALEATVRAIVVDRGGEAMPVRDPLPLHLPEEAQAAAEEAAAAENDARPAPGLPERGPEITERR